MKKQFLSDSAGNRIAVVLDIKEYKEMLDELESVRAYDAAKPAVNKAMMNGDYVTIEEYASRHKKKSSR